MGVMTPVWPSEKKPPEMTWKRQNQFKCFSLEKSPQPGNNSDTESTNNANEPVKPKYPELHSMSDPRTSAAQTASWRDFSLHSPDIARMNHH